MISTAPIALFTFNRINETKKTVFSLLNNHLSFHTELYIFSDGPRNDADIVKIKLVREYLRSVTGFKMIYFIENKQNQGLAKSIIYGVSEVLQKHDKVIVLEDDLITSPNFLDFMNQALSFYENDSNILSVSGYTLDLPSLPGNKDYYFGYRASSWGWGCWKDRWEKIDWEITDYDEFINSKELTKKFNRGGSDMTKMLKNHKYGLIDSWAIRFCYHQFKYDLKSVFPTTSKVQSIGFSKDATHTVGTRRFDTPMDDGSKTEFSFSKFQKMNQQLVKEFKNKFSIKNRILDKLTRILF
jgi:hypothetical protein